MNNNQTTELRPLLRRAGMKATPGHLEIISIIKKSKKPISSQDVIDVIGKKLDPATVYRCMTKLKNSGIIRQIDLRQNHAHYEFLTWRTTTILFVLIAARLRILKIVT